MTDDESDGPTTDNPNTRWDYTNDVAALLLVLSFVGAIVAASYAVIAEGMTADVDLGILVWAYVALVLLAGTWLFGSDAFDALARLRR